MKTIRLEFRPDGHLDFEYRAERDGCVIREERVVGSAVTENGNMQMQWSFPANSCTARADACAPSPVTRCDSFEGYSQRLIDFRISLGCPAGARDRRACVWDNLTIGNEMFRRVEPSADGGGASDASASD